MIPITALVAFIRAVIFALCGVEVLTFLWILFSVANTHSDPMGEGIASGFAAIAVLLFVLFTLPALILTVKNRALGVAFVLSLVPFAVFYVFRDVV